LNNGYFASLPLTNVFGRYAIETDWNRKMKTLICPTCGCSLVRLGLSELNIATRKYKNEEYSFCCNGCAVIFDNNPDTIINETKDLVVCPSCLAEKPIDQTVVLNHNGNTLYFCKCPFCITVFKENSEYYIKRLSGEIEFSGVFSGGHGCCA
jgi:YHS domain-containing protein